MMVPGISICIIMFHFLFVIIIWYISLVLFTIIFPLIIYLLCLRFIVFSYTY